MKQRCIITDKEFEITPEELRLYNKLAVQTPRISPEERSRQRLAFRNERKLYRRSCTETGKSFISIYSPSSPYTVFEKDYWWSDAWDQHASGRPFDFTRPFFEQFADLLRESPLPPLVASNNENSEYVNLETMSANCYLNVGGRGNTGGLYNTYSVGCSACVDNYWIFDSELLYECMDCANCYNSAFLRNCRNSANCYFSYDLANCNNCFGCVGLRRAENVICGEKVSAKAFKDFCANLSKYSWCDQMRTEFQEQLRLYPRRFAEIDRSEECLGHQIANCKNCHHCFQLNDSVDCCYLYIAAHCKDSCDLNAIGYAELCYDSVAGTKLYDVQFCVTALHTNHAAYCYNVFDSDNLFGCAGLKRSKYCILNTQYSEEEYRSLRQRIAAHMIETGETGRFFPPFVSPFGYDETAAQEYFPLSRERAQAEGFRWHGVATPTPSALSVVSAASLSDSIDDSSDAILSQAIECETSKQLYRITAAELALHRQLGIALPRRHPDIRHADRLKQRTPFRLLTRNCAETNVEVLTPYPSEFATEILCDEAYFARLE